MKLIIADDLLKKINIDDMYSGLQIANLICDAEPVESDCKDTAHWNRQIFINNEGGREIRSVCSHCNKTNKQYEPPFCPHCGYKMIKGD